MKLIIISISTVFILLLLGGFFLYQRQAITPPSSPPSPQSSLKLYSLAPDQKTLTPPKTTFRAADPVTFVLTFEKKPTSFWPFAKEAHAQGTSLGEWKDESQTIKTEVIYGKEEKVAEGITVEIKPQEENRFSFSLLQKDPNQFKPGKYQFRVTREVQGQTQELTQDFVWGVLAINTNKSIFTPGEKVYLQMASLSESGRTLCNSDLKLEVTDPQGHPTSLTPQNSPTCGNDNVTDNPDYYSYYQLPATSYQLGAYHLKLTNNSNKYSIEDSFEVKKSVPFVVERVGATRINPFKSEYTMNLRVTANQDFEGEVVEQLPSDFQISNISNNGVILASPRDQNPSLDSGVVASAPPQNDNSQQSNNETMKQLKWPLSLKSGQSTTLSYTYQAPKISPEIFLLGPLTMKQFNNETIVFSESRQWQIASDAVTTIFMETPDATNATTGNTGTEFWTSVTGSVTYDTTQKKSGNGSWKADSGAGNAAAYLHKNLTGSYTHRTTVYIRLTDLPTSTVTIVRYADDADATSGRLRITSGGVLQLWDATAQIGGNGATLSTGVWYRVSIVINIGNNVVFVDGSSSITATTNIYNGKLYFGWLDTPGASKVLNFHHVYVDDSTALTDTGDIRVTAKQANAGVHTNFSTNSNWPQAISERPISTSNYITHGSTTQVHEDYDIQSMSAGDVNIFGNKIVALNSWVYAADGTGANGTPKQIYFDGSSGDQESAVSLTTTATLFQKIVDTPNYPGSGIAAVGMESTGAGADTIFYEGGVLVAYKIQPPAMQFTGIKMQGIKIN